MTAGRLNVTVGADGFVSVKLAPNLGSMPAGLYYTAVYHLSDGTTSTEYWVVPASAQASLTQVRAQVMPAAQAVQAVSKGYVDQSIAELTQSLLTASGGSLSGPLFLNGDPTQPTQATTKRYVDNEFAQAMPLSGGVASGPLTGVQLGAAYQVDQFPGGDFGAKLQACLNKLNAVYGGTCDARNFTGTQAAGSAVVISTANATVQLPCATIATANQIRITAGTRNVAMRGCALRGASDASGSEGGTVFLYSGKGPSIQVGDPTYAVNTLGFHLDNVVINTTASSDATAQGLAAYRTQEISLQSLYLLGNSNQTGITLDGTGNYTGGTFEDIELGGFGSALNAIGHQGTSSTPTDWVNASTFVRLHINCPTNADSPTSGTYGINLLQGDGNTFTGGDVEGCGTALHLGPNAQNNTIIGLRNENSINQVVADTGSSYNNWITGGTMFTGQLTDNGTRNSFLDTFHRSFNGLNGDWYGSQTDATITNHYRFGTGTGTERGLLNRYQTDYGYRWTTGLSDASAGEQFYQLLDELNNVYRLSVGQYNHGQPSTNNQTVLNAAGTGAVVLNGSANAGTGGVIFGAGGSTGAAVATINSAGNAQFNGSLQVGGPSTFTNSTTVKNQSDEEIDSVLWAGATGNQKESYSYKDYTGASQWYMVKDANNNWALNSAMGGLNSFKAYQSYNSGDTYINAGNSTGHIRLNYEAGTGAETDIYSGPSSTLVAAFLGSNSIKFPGLAAAGGRNCLQIDNSGYISNTGTQCGSGGGSGTVGTGNAGQVAYYMGNGTTIAGTSAVGVTAGGTGATNAAAAVANLGAASASALLTETARAQAGEATNASVAAAAQASASAALPANGATSTGGGINNTVSFPGTVVASTSVSAPNIPVSVIKYGADPTGTNNSQPAFQACANSGNACYLPAGTYKLNSVVRFHNCGGGLGITDFFGDPGVAPNMFPAIINAPAGSAAFAPSCPLGFYSTVSFRNMEIIGGKNGIDLGLATSTSLQDIGFRDQSGYAITHVEGERHDWKNISIWHYAVQGVGGISLADPTATIDAAVYAADTTYWGTSPAPTGWMDRITIENLSDMGNGASPQDSYVIHTPPVTNFTACGGWGCSGIGHMRIIKPVCMWSGAVRVFDFEGAVNYLTIETPILDIMGKVSTPIQDVLYIGGLAYNVTLIDFNPAESPSTAYINGVHIVGLPYMTTIMDSNLGGNGTTNYGLVLDTGAPWAHVTLINDTGYVKNNSSVYSYMYGAFSSIGGSITSNTGATFIPNQNTTNGDYRFFLPPLIGGGDNCGNWRWSRAKGSLSTVIDDLTLSCAGAFFNIPLNVGAGSYFNGTGASISYWNFTTTNSQGPANAMTLTLSPANPGSGGGNVVVAAPLSATSLTATGLGASSLPVCPNGAGGALTTSGCSGASGGVVATVAPALYSGTTSTGYVTLYTPPAAHQYMLCYFLDVVTPASAGQIQFVIQGITDGKQTYVANTGYISATTQWTLGQGCQSIYVDANQPIQWQLYLAGVSGTPRFRYAATLTQLQ